MKIKTIIINILILLILLILSLIIVMHGIRIIKVRGKGYLLEYHKNDYVLTQSEKNTVMKSLNNVDIYNLDNISIGNYVDIDIYINNRHNRAVGTIKITGKYNDISEIDKLFSDLGLIYFEQRSETSIYLPSLVGNDISGTIEKGNVFTLSINSDLYYTLENENQIDDLAAILINFNKTNLLNKLWEIIIIYTIFVILIVFFNLLLIKRKAK